MTSYYVNYLTPYGYREAGPYAALEEAVAQKKDQQLRYNKDKPKLSYLLANENCMCCFMAGVEPDNRHRLLLVSGYLNGGGQDLLANAAWGCLLELQGKLTGYFSTDCADILDLFAKCPEAVAEVCAVYEFGESKYDRGNYRKGAPVTQYIDSALRHEFAQEALDKESGKHTLAHAFWNYWQALNQPEERDDRLPRVAL